MIATSRDRKILNDGEEARGLRLRQGRSRLVQDQHLRLVGQGAGDRDELAFGLSRSLIAQSSGRSRPRIDWISAVRSAMRGG